MIILSSCYLLLINAVTSRRDKTLSHNRITTLILLYSTFLALNSLHMTCIETGIGVYGGLFLVTTITQNFVVFIFILSFLYINIESFYCRNLQDINDPDAAYDKGRSAPFDPSLVGILDTSVNADGKYNIMVISSLLDFPIIILFILTGAVCLMSCCDLITMFLCLELQSYGLYILCSIYRNSELVIGAGLTYFLLGGLWYEKFYFRAGLLYANTGLTYLDGIYMIYNLSDTMITQGQEIISLLEYQVKTWIKSDEINSIHTFDMSLIILSVGYLFKVSSAPFHFWSPFSTMDVYDALPTIITCFVAVMAKISIFIFMLDLVHFASGLWLISSFFSLIIGTIVGLIQVRIKKLFAYSTISHVGFILLALTINTIESIQAFIFYLIQYSLSNLNFFIILLTMGYYLYYYYPTLKMTDQVNSPLQFIDQLKGFFNKNHMLSLCLAITLFSFAGIPPLLGFFGKQLVLSAALDKGFYFMTLVAIITSAIGASYYLVIIKSIYFDKDRQIVDEHFVEIIYDIYWNSFKLKGEKVNILNNKNRLLSTSLSLIISGLTLIILLFIIKPLFLLSMASVLALILFNT
uniref:NADH dehydrogenase subunit 2 n=1 Tax=Drechslerella dactyloides TaxID=74499 RepID=UPI0022FD8B18|nr:NADH dehydrogenase subunit 2 [Drechslerella dactyloides]WAN89802.1 NADH dehydrogenase subunit 2 [Drechslerella dactyloides]